MGNYSSGRKATSGRATWAARATATNGVATATKSAVSGKRHVLKGAAAAFGGATPPTSPVVVTIGNSSVYISFSLSDQNPSQTIYFGDGLDVFGENQDVNITLGAGGASVEGAVSIWGETI